MDEFILFPQECKEPGLHMALQPWFFAYADQFFVRECLLRFKIYSIRIG